MERFPPNTLEVFMAVAAERRRQDEKWGRQDHDFGSWLAIFQEELGEACREQMEMRYRCDEQPMREIRGDRFRKELVESIAVLVAAVECGDRRGWFR